MADLWRSDTLNAPVILRRRACAEGIAPWLGVGRVLISAVKLIGLRANLPSARASSAD
jgi:hypothetical protein